jgi:hypothetical protein
MNEQIIQNILHEWCLANSNNNNFYELELEPHEGVKESYVHPASDNVMSDTKDKTPAVRQSKDPQYQNEHEILSDLHDHVTKDYSVAIHRMTSASHMINADLLDRKPVHPMWAGVHNKLSEMFAKTPPLDREHHVYSGMGDFDPQEHFKEKRGYFYSPSYISTSIAPQVAVRHSNLKAFGTEHEHIMHFILPKGYKGGHYIANYSPFAGEHEMLLKPGQQWKVTAHNKYSIKRSDGSSAIRHVYSAVPH